MAALSDDNTITVRLAPELTPVRSEERVDLNAEIDVAVESRLTGLGMAGVATIAIGVLAMVAGLLLFLMAYPDVWYAKSVTWEESRRAIERVVLLLAGGIVALFLGSSMFFYGRTVLGSGTLDQFQMQEPVEQAPAEAT